MLTATINEVRISTDAKNLEVVVAFHADDDSFDQVNVYPWEISDLKGDDNENRKMIREYVRDRTNELVASLIAATKLKEHFNDGGLSGMVMAHDGDPKSLVRVVESIGAADARNPETPDVGKAVGALD